MEAGEDEEKRLGLEGEVKVVSRGGGPPAVLSPPPGHRYPLLTGASPGVLHSRLRDSHPSSEVLLPAKERQRHETAGRPWRGREGHVHQPVLTSASPPWASRVRGSKKTNMSIPVS